MTTALSRRGFMVSASATGAVLLGAGPVRALDGPTPWAGEPIVDCHFHDRPTDEAMIAHLDGAGVSNGFVLAGIDFDERMKGLEARHPGRILGWGRSTRLAADDGPMPTDELARMAASRAVDAAAALRSAVARGARGFAETVGVVAVDGPELRRLYAIAAELDVAVMMHFQESVIPGLPRYGITGFSRIERVLRDFPNTRFVCHASDFWGHIDAKFTDGGAYPTGKVNAGGLTERLLVEYPNIHGDFGAPSGLMQLARDPEFTAGFLERHAEKLLFGSDCGCTDGRGGAVLPPPGDTSSAGSMQVRMAAQGGLGGKCIARELLRIAWTATDRATFRKITWTNAHRVYRLGAA